VSSRLRVLLVFAGATGLAALVNWAPGVLSHVEVFRVAQVRVEGTRFLDPEEAVEVAAIPPGANLWEDPAPWVARLREHPLVGEVRARRRLPGTLVLVVEERSPVALLPLPTLEPVDGTGVRLPIDPALHRLDLPLLRPGADGLPGEEGVSPARLRLLTEELERLTRVEPDFSAAISELGMGPGGEMVAVLGDPSVAFLFRAPLTPERLREGMVVLADARERRPELVPEAVDLRFADQVVVRFPRRRTF